MILLMVETILIAFLISRKKGYRAEYIFKRWEFYPIFLFSFVYIYINANIFRENYSLIKYSRVLEMTYILAFIPLILRLKLFSAAIYGSISIFIGTLLNRLAMSANYGKMPVFPSLSKVTHYYKEGVFEKILDIHVLGNSATKFKFLTDYIDLGYSILSIGDIFIRFFTFIIIYTAIKRLHNTYVGGEIC